MIAHTFKYSSPSSFPSSVFYCIHLFFSSQLISAGHPIQLNLLHQIHSLNQIPPAHLLLHSFEMLYSYVAIALLGSAGLVNAAALDMPLRRQAGGNQNQGASPTCLAANALQSASDLTGQESGTDGIKPGQAPSAT